MEQGERISFTNVQWLLLVHNKNYLGKSNICFPPKETLRPSVPIMQRSPLLNGSTGLILLPKEKDTIFIIITSLLRPSLRLPPQHSLYSTQTLMPHPPPLPLCISCMVIITGQPLKIELWMNQRPECFLCACLYPAPALCSVRKVFERRRSWQSRDSSQQTRKGDDGRKRGREGGREGSQTGLRFWSKSNVSGGSWM